MKILIKLTIVIALIFSTPTIKAQDPVTAASVVKGLYTAAKWTHSNWKFIKWCFTGLEHRWWACIYQDGFVTYNNFRSYRTSMEAYNYFVKGRGDCDAVYGNSNRRICYENPMQAKRYTDQHGPIADIQYQDKYGNYHSVFEY
jgi:hypothetical protein